MEDATIDFNLIPFADVKSAPFATAPISRAELRDRILFARTNLGNFAKLQVKSGDNLLITRLTVYNPAGCIIKTAYNLTIHSSFSCDLDNAVETSAGADFWWHGVSAGVNFLEAKNAAAFHLFKGFDQVTFDDVHNAAYVARRVERNALRDQILFCRTNQGRFAKLLVEAGDTLIVRRMTVWRPDGTLHLDRSNISIPRTWTLDVDSGNVGASGYDLWWESVTNTEFYLVPANGAAISFPSYFRFEKYLPLLRNAAIRAAMLFQDAAGTRAYDAWSDGEKYLLNEFLWRRENGLDLPIAGPPALTGDRFISSCDAWKIYLAHVSQSLWIDATSAVAWHLTGTSADSLAHLFDMRKLLAFTAGSGHSFEFGTMGAVTQWSPSLAYQFLHDSSLIRADHWQTIKAVADWCRANLIHITGYAGDPDGGPFATQADQYQYIYGYRGLPLVDRMIAPLPGRKHTTHGCWGTDGFFAALLRTVNIPVRHGRTNFDGNSHSRAEFFSAGQNLAHGDDPYNGWVRLGHNNVPIERIFYDNASLAAQIDGVPPHTTSVNHDRKQVALAVEFKTEYLLHYRCLDHASGATGSASQLWQNIHDFYTDAQVAAIAADCDTAIAAIAGGCASIHAV